MRSSVFRSPILKGLIMRSFIIRSPIMTSTDDHNYRTTFPKDGHNYRKCTITIMENCTLQKFGKISVN